MHTLHKLRDLRWTLEDYYWLCRRKRSMLAPSERARFTDAPYIMDFRRDTDTNPEDNCNYFNRMRLRRHAKEHNKDVAQFSAYHKGISEEKGAQIDEGQFKGLAKTLEIAEDARVILTHNLMPEQGLMNGTQGSVKKIVYNHKEGPNAADIPTCMPSYVVVDFPQYVGPPFYDEPERRTWVPLEPREIRQEDNAGVSRVQFPIILAWALTPWKAQGMTLDKAVVFIGRRAATPGVLFVALTRVRHPDDLMLDDDFPDMSTIMKQKQTQSFQRRQMWERSMTVKFSQTLRREMRDDKLYDPKMTWTEEMSTAADAILNDLRQHASPGKIIEDALHRRGTRLGLPQKVVQDVCQRLERWPHSYEVDHAAGRLAVNEQELDHEMLRNTKVVHPTYDWNKWRVDRKDWTELVMNGTVTLAMFEHFAKMLRGVLPQDTFLCSPYKLNKCTLETAAKELIKGKKENAHRLWFPYLTKQSKRWVLFMISLETDHNKLTIFAPGKTGTFDASAYTFAMNCLKKAFDVKTVQTTTMSFSGSEDMLTLREIREYHQENAPRKHDEHVARENFLLAVLNYARAVIDHMKDSPTNDIKA